MDKKALTALIIALLVIEFLVSCHIFITFEEMAAYAAPKDSLQLIEEQLNRIESKIDKIMGL